MFENQLASGFRLLVGPICAIALSTLEAQSDGGKDVLVEPPANEQASNPSDWLSPLPAKDSRIPLPKTGALYERWDGVAGNTISDLRNSQAFLEEQSHIGIIQGLSTPPGDGKDYGVRIRAWIVAPKNGKVRFVTSSDDNSELWLSPNADPFQRREIAWIAGEGWFGWTAPGQTNRINSQWSAPQPMVAGNSYYLEVWHKERNSDDHLSVLWQWEDDEKPLPVPPEVLRPSQLHPADADDNGLPDAWEAKTGLARLGNGHAWQDSDGDGILNLHEYQAGTDPLDGGFTRGTLRWEIWFGIPGGEVADLTRSARFAAAADRVLPIAGSSTPVMTASNFGSRLSGYIVPERDGDYQFALTADDAGELWFSPDENPSNRELIAFCDVWRAPQRWNAVTAQQSKPVTLRAGQAYYFEILHKDHHAPGRLDLGWRPAESEQSFTPIPASMLHSPRAAPEAAKRGHLAETWLDIHASKHPDGPDAARRALLPYGNPSGDRIPNWVKARENLDPFTRYERPGGLTREWWFRSPGGSLESALRARHHLRSPSMISHTQGSQADQDTTDHFLSRLRGTITIPETALFRFWIAGDDHCQLWLSDNARKFHKQLIAHVGPAGFESPDTPAWTDPLDWDARPGQRSREFQLTQGTRRYLEILHKDANGDDHVAVAWQRKLPGQSQWGPREIIPPEFLHAYAGDPDDLDDDYLPDSWEIRYGLDPTDNGIRDPRQGESGDFDGDGLTNHEEYLLGTDPTNPDTDGDGVSDYDEIRVYGSNPNRKDVFPPVKVADINLINRVAHSGSWHPGADGSLIATERLGFVELVISVRDPGLHMISITAAAHSERGFVSAFPLGVALDGQFLGSMNVSHTKQRSSFLTPALRPGTYTLRLTNHNPVRGTTLEILGVEIHFHENTGSLEDESPGWFEQYLKTRNFVDETPRQSFVSPVCLEGVARHFRQVSLTSGKGIIPVQESLTGRWYADVPLDENHATTVNIRFEEGAISSSLELSWSVTDLSSLQAPILLRPGDSIRVAAHLADEQKNEKTAELLLDGERIYQGPACTPQTIRFEKAGIYRLQAIMQDQGEPLVTNAEIRVLAAEFAAPASIASGVHATWHLPGMDKEIEIQADTEIDWTEVENPDARYGRQLRLSRRDESVQDLRMIARLPDNGAIANAIALPSYRVVDSARSLDAHVVDVLADGTRVVEIGIVIDGAIPKDLSIWIELAVPDAVFSNGETRWHLTSADFGNDGIASITILKSPGVGVAAVCHWLHIGEEPVSGRIESAR